MISWDTILEVKKGTIARFKYLQMATWLATQEWGEQEQSEFEERIQDAVIPKK
mgnify:CR=1 FL=1